MPIDITFNLSVINRALSASNLFMATWELFRGGLWIVPAIFAPLILWWGWIGWRQNKYVKDWKFILLAIDIPRLNEQSPKAVEYIFSQLWGAYMKGNLIDRYWDGRVQESFSMEIVSDGGYLQFCIYTLDKFRDLVEASIYAQYPDAIITEIDDYAQSFKNLRFPNNEYDLWVSEMKLAKPNGYPIRTYPLFEHTLSQELKDPMAGLLEILSRMKPGEKYCIQLVVKPINDSWIQDAQNVVAKIMGKKASSKTLIDRLTDLPLTLINLVSGAIFTTVDTAKDEAFTIMKLTPGESDILKAVQNKMSKIAFRTVFRLLYLSPKELYDKKRGISGVVGAIQQFSTLNLNGILPDWNNTTNGPDYIFVKLRERIRQNRLLRMFRERSTDGTKMILNIEELATLYHFPIMTVKAPMLARTESKRGEPPVSLPKELPIDTFVSEQIEEKDEFVSLLEDLAAKRQTAIGDEENLPEDLLGIDKDVRRNWQEDAVQKTMVAEKEVAKTKSNVPKNLPI